MVEFNGTERPEWKGKKAVLQREMVGYATEVWLVKRFENGEEDEDADGEEDEVAASSFKVVHGIFS